MPLSDWQDEIREAVDALIGVAKLAGVSLESSQIQVLPMKFPHKPPSSLPPGKMAIYAFHDQKEWLKIGIAGPESGPRYVSHHYNLSANSSLSKSLVNDTRMQLVETFDAMAPGKWVKATCNRVNILIPTEVGRDVLALFEAFLHVRLKPRYEQRQTKVRNLAQQGN